jgi:hypothetical protein
VLFIHARTTGLLSSQAETDVELELFRKVEGMPVVLGVDGWVFWSGFHARLYFPYVGETMF